MFISRSVASGKTLHMARNANFVQMPEMSSKGKQLYRQTWGPEVYDVYATDNANVQRFHGGVRMPGLIKDLAPEIPFCHRPDHDMESTFWSFAVTALSLCPAGQARPLPQH